LLFPNNHRSWVKENSEEASSKEEEGRRKKPRKTRKEKKHRSLVHAMTESFQESERDRNGRQIQNINEEENER